ncbi:MAG: family 10 glycosylhydrolase [Microcoleaceae cyanobacterium]
MSSKKENAGCGCTSIPISLVVVFLGFGYWGFRNLDRLPIARFLPNYQQSAPAEVTAASDQTVPGNHSTPASNEPTSPISNSPNSSSPAAPNSNSPVPSLPPAPIPNSQASPATPVPNSQDSDSPTAPKGSSLQAIWKEKEIRGIYLSRYQATNNASEQTIRERVRYYHSQGINTIIHGVWGNGCTMYNSEVMQQTFGYNSCPNQFQAQWIDWLIDEAHKQGMEVHAYFEKGIKIDENSPIFDEAVAKRWIVPGVDKTYAGIDHYVLDVEIPEVANLFKQISVEFVKKYPTIDAVQWDDYLGYHDELPGKVDRTTRLTNFVRQMRDDIKTANPNVSFDLCHHNPYWGKRYFAADWKNWNADRVFIQIYNDANFNEELNYAENHAGVAISDQQLNRLEELVNNPKIKSILLFPSSGQSEEDAAKVNQLISAN